MKHVKTKVRVKSVGDSQKVIILTREETVRPAPDTLGDALENGLQELFGFLRSNRRPFRPETIETLLKHVKDRIKIDFEAVLNDPTVKESTKDTLRKLWEKMFPSKSPKTAKLPKGGLRSA